MSDSVSSNSDGGFSMSVSASPGDNTGAPIGADGYGVSAPSGTDGTSGGANSGDVNNGVSTVNLGFDNTTITGPGVGAGGDGIVGTDPNGAISTSTDQATSLSVTAYSTPAGTVPLTVVTIGHTADPQFAKQEAVAIGFATTKALTLLHVNKDFATLIGGQVTAAMFSPGAQAVLQAGNDAAVNGISVVAESGASQLFGLSVGDPNAITMAFAHP